MSRYLLLVFVLGLMFVSPTRAAEPPTKEALDQVVKLINEHAEAMKKEDYDKAEEHATALIKLGTEGPAVTYNRRAYTYLARDKFAAAAADLAEAQKVFSTPDRINFLGTIRYQAGQLIEALADFDRAIKLEPRLEAGHWQRGIVYYDLGQWENGRKQFEQYQGVDDNDVENVVWRAMCMARDPKFGWEKAAGDLWKVKHDRRVPLMVVHQLFADKATEADVLKAVDEGNPGEAELLSRRFYAHLYLGLYHEVRGNKTEALKHLELASGKYKLPGYMAEVARVHVGLLKEKK